MSSSVSPRYPDLESHVNILSDGLKEQWERVVCDSSNSVPKGRDEEATLGHNTDIAIGMIRFCVAGTFISLPILCLSGTNLAPEICLCATQYSRRERYFIFHRTENDGAVI